MNEVVNLNFVTDGTLDRIINRRRQFNDIQLEVLRRKIGHMEADAKEALRYLRALYRDGVDVSEELREISGLRAAIELDLLLLVRSEQ